LGHLAEVSRLAGLAPTQDAQRLYGPPAWPASSTASSTAKLNGLDPERWLRDVLARIADHPINQIAALLPWNWKPAP
jgi:hypothetical protein